MMKIHPVLLAGGSGTRLWPPHGNRIQNNFQN